MGTIQAPSTGPTKDAAESLPVAGPERGPSAIRRMLVCLDGSPMSEFCLPDAIDLARTFGSSITLLTVLPPGLDAGSRPCVDPLDSEIAKLQAQAYLDRVANGITGASDLRVDTRVEHGHPAERIVALSRELGADLTVLGSHGESGLTEWALGGTARQVLAELRGSVLVGRSTPRREALPGARRRILAPLDGTSRSESVLPTVVSIANARGAEVLLAHVAQEPLDSVMLSSEEDLALARELASRVETRATQYLERLRSQLARQGTSARALVLRRADVLKALLDMMPREAIELVVLSAHGATCNPEHPFGSVTGHLVAHATVPVLVLQDLSDSELDQSDPARKAHRAPTLRASFAPGND